MPKLPRPGFFRLFIRVRILQALVELHLDVGAKQALDLHGPLWREFIASPVNMRLENGPLLRDFADLCQ
jgi:hypothetical protein